MELNPPSSATTQSTASLAPGFRFHPTDEELVRYYLRRKVTGKPFRFDAITEIDIYKTEPWDLPGLSKLKSRDLEWYFFSVLDKKYGNGSKTNRATEKGYWKTTGKDRPVFHKTQTVGMKKTLVYHSGRAPKGARSNWVMHEYRLVDGELDKAGINPREAFVLCRIFQKSGTGPKNGEQYGAPLVEDEWENADLVIVPGEVATEVAVSDDFYLDGDEIEQILETEIPSEEVPLPDSFYYGDEGIQVEQQENTIDGPQEPLLEVCGSIISQEFDGHKLFHLPVQNGLDMKIVKHEYIGESSNSVDTEDVDYLIDEPFLDATINPPMDDEAYMEASDLSNPIRENHSSFDRVEDYLNFFDTKEDNSLYGDLFSSMIMGSENLGCNEMPLFEQDVNGGAFQENVECKQVFQDQMPIFKQDVNCGAPEKNGESRQVLPGQNNDVASTSNDESSYYESAKENNFPDIMHHPFLKQAGCMLGKTSEFPSKGPSLGANHSSSSIHVTAGMIRIRNISVTVDGTYWAPRKRLEVDIVLPFGNAQISEDGGDSLLSKSADPISPLWYYLMIFIWVMILPLSFKIGACFYTGKAF